MNKFFRTYSNSDFLKYFDIYNDEVEAGGMVHARINFKCKAAMKFLPYKGFYPAERAVELTRIFQDNYLSQKALVSNADFRDDMPMTTDHAKRYLFLRANASKYQSTKPLFGPGILFNSIKSGVAVDYPIFYSNTIVFKISRIYAHFYKI